MGRFVLGALMLGLLAVAWGSAARADDGWVVLTYHRFGQDQYPTTSVRLTQFDQHLAAIRDGGFTVLPLQDLVDALANGAPIPSRAIAITVDDGYSSVFREGWPRMQRYGFPFTLFVSTDAADGGAGDLMTWDQIREMAADPLVTIGHHGAAHAHMADMDATAAQADIDRASARFMAELGYVPPLFAYPYGEYGRGLRDQIENSGFSAAFGQQSGAIDRWSDRYGLPRFPINANTGLDAFRLRLAAMPLPAADQTPDDLVVSDSANPPVVSFRLVQPEDDGGPLRPDAMTCYFNGAQVAFDRTDDAITIQMPGPLSSGRSRLNCTMPADNGRWRWHGVQFYRP